MFPNQLIVNHLLFEREKRERPTCESLPTFVSKQVHRVYCSDNQGDYEDTAQNKQIIRRNNSPFRYIQPYNICQILDRGVFPRQWTSYRLRYETIYFQSDSNCYELKRYLPSHAKYVPEKNYCLSRVMRHFGSDETNNQTISVLLALSTIPLKSDDVTIVHDHFSWYDVKWGMNGVTICNVPYPIQYLEFFFNS